MTTKGKVPHETYSIRSGHSKKHPQGIKKIEEKSTLTSHEKMEQGESRNGSSGWTEGRWWGIQAMMPQGTFPLSWTSTPQGSTTTMMTTNPQGHSPSGSSQHWWEAALPSPPSAVPLTSSLPTIGGLWLRSIGIVRWTSNAKAFWPNSTSSNKRWRQRVWSGVSVKGGSRQPKPTSTSAASVWAKQGRGTSKTRYEEMYSAKCGSNTAVDMGVHSSEERGITGLGCQMPL